MEKLKIYISRNRKKLAVIMIMLVCAIGIMMFVKNDYFLYSKTIVTVESIEEKCTDETETALGFTEREYTQKITAQIRNGENKGKSVVITNYYSSSQVVSERYEKGDDIFVSISAKGENLKASAEGFKRDGYFVFTILVFVLAIVFVGELKGFLSVVSVVFNIAVFMVAIELYFQGINLFVLCASACVLFSVVSLSLVSGLNRKTVAAVISTLTGTFITIIIAVVVLKVTNGSGVRFEQMEYLIRPYEVIFISELLVGGLGAIMDISVTMATSMSELIEKDRDISYSALIKSGREIGRDVMGTMVNVLFFTYVCGCVPLIVLALRNDAAFSDIMQNYISLEIVRSLVGSIGIVITIPVSMFVSARLLRGKKRGAVK